MAETSIEWTDKTWNPTRGCSRVSEGCRHCYAETLAGRYSAFGTNPDSPFAGFVTKVNGHAAWTGKVELVESMLKLPMNWRKPCRIFVNSMSDLFHEALPDEAIDRVFAVMCLAHNHTYQILTKRPQRMKVYMDSAMPRVAKLLEEDHGPYPDGINWPPRWVWLGVSVEDQATADERIPLLLQTPAAIRFVSYEPALGPISFRWAKWAPIKPWPESNNHLDGLRMLDWVIVGGESGPGARRFDLEWMRATVEQCKAAGVAVFCKQIGSNPHWARYELGRARPSDRKGGSMEEWPKDLRIRQFPFVQSPDKVHNDSGRVVRP